MIFSDKETLEASVGTVIADRPLAVTDPDRFREKTVRDLMDTIVLGKDRQIRDMCLLAVRKAAQAFGVVPMSIHPLYHARAVEDFIHFTVPAMNLRTLSFTLARAVFRAALKIGAGAFVFEIARSEMKYTAQPPKEYTAAILLAAVREGFQGPVFIQGDHFQVKPKAFQTDRDKEIQALKDLILESMDAGFYNIDIDSSTLVDLSQKTLDGQQKLNYEICAELTRFIRKNQPSGLDVSVGGEIGEVGGHNSTPEELQAFMDGFRRLTPGILGLSKVSIQTGTSHGGVVLPDGSIADVSIDFDTLKNLSRMARTKFGMAGAVQHGASTLPKEAFHHFPVNECVEVHLATQFQNIIYDLMPEDLKKDIYGWLRSNMQNERGSNQTEEQFLYKTRKKALKPFKKKIYSLPEEWKDRVSGALEKEFSFLFDKLNIQETKELVDRIIPIF